MGPIGVQEMIVIFLVALLLFGPKKLPELGRMLGKALSEFRRAKSELKSTFEGHLRELERETHADQQPKAITSDRDYASSSYRPPYQSSSYGGASYESSRTPYETTTSSDAPPPEPPVANAPDPVEGTMARSNGDRPAKAVSVPAEEEHPA